MMICIFYSNAVDHLSAHTASVVLLFLLKPLWVSARSFYTLLTILSSAIIERRFRIVFGNTIGLKLLSGSFGLPYFCRTIRIPVPISISFSDSIIWLSMFTRHLCRQLKISFNKIEVSILYSFAYIE